MSQTDLDLFELPDLSWDNRLEAYNSLKKLYELARRKAIGDVQWYMNKRKGRRRAAQLLRFLAALLAAGGLLIPASALVWTTVKSDLGYVFLVGAGVCLLINRALGISSGWLRYVTTAFEITTRLSTFQLEWVQAQARLAGSVPVQDEIVNMLNHIKQFVVKMNEIVENETRTWAAQFLEDLSALESVVQARVQTLQAAQRTRREEEDNGK